MKLFTKGGTKQSDWAIMERFDIPHLDDPRVNYLTRWRIIQTPWFAVYLHQINTPDSRPTLHDHPWNFTSIILRGGYWERRRDPKTLEVYDRQCRRINRMKTYDAHAITRLLRSPTWTLMFVGRRARTWGYYRRVYHATMIEAIKSYDTDPSRPFAPFTFKEVYADGEWTWTAFDRDEHALEFDNVMAARKAIDNE